MMLVISFAVFIAALLSLLIYARWNYGTLEKCGIPVISPSFLLGSVPEIHEKVQHLEDIRRAEKYGQIYGLYQGRTPIVFVTEPNIIKRIFIQDVEHFRDKEPFSFGNPYLNEILDYLNGEKWKIMRASQTRLFTPAKIRNYGSSVFPVIMQDFCRKLDHDIESAANGKLKIDTRKNFATITVEGLGRALFSMESEHSEGGEFYAGLMKLIGEDQVISKYYIWTLVFPFLSMLEPALVLDPAIVRTFSNLLSKRKFGAEKKDDFPDIMLQLEEKLGSSLFRKLGITRNTLLGQAVNLFGAGFDLTSSLMSCLFYHLAEVEEIQEKLYQELKQRGPDDSRFLQACIREACRLYPPFIRPERLCTKDWICKEIGIKIPKGTVIQIPAWAANRNPDVYDRPNDFLPERFLNHENGNLNPYAETTFGFGHRICIGKRFALEAMRVSVAHLMLNYKFSMREDTKLEFKKGLIFVLQFEPLYLDVAKR